MKTLTSLLLLATSLVSVPALADCDYLGHKAGTHNGVVPEWSYSHSFRSEAPLAAECSAEAEDIDCEGEGLFGLDCAYKMQRIFTSCVGRNVCDDLVQGLLEDGDVVGQADISTAYGACLDLVAAAGGQD